MTTKRQTRRGVRWGVAFLAVALVVVPTHADGQAPVPQSPEGDDKTPYSDIELVSAVESIQPGTPFTLGVHITVDPGWHTYWINGGDAGDELLVDWSLPEGFQAGDFEWPVPHLLPAPPLMSYGYEGQLLVLVEMVPPQGLRPGSTAEIRGAADFQVCADICLIALADVAIELPVRAAPPLPDQNWSATLADTRARLPTPAEGWTVRAWTNGSEGEDAAYVLEVSPDGSSAAPAPATLPAPYLYSDGDFVIEHAMPQRVARVGDAIRMSIPRNYFESGYQDRLGGILVADVDSESPVAWWVDAEVSQEPPADVAAQANDPLEGVGVVETGGVPEGMAPLGRPIEIVEVRAGANGSRLGLLAALAFAFLGGAILNLMPCVLPVVSTKVLGLVGRGREDPGRARTHGLAFTAGVVLSLWALAGALIALRAGGQSLGWGFQLQSPPIVGLLALLLFALGLNMSGLFEMGVGLTRLGGVGKGDGYRDSVLMGGLTVLVATPCTGPFMGAALGFALVQPAAIGLGVFTAFALGLAAPYALLSSSPALLRYLPRPGAWMETVRQALAFPMYATVVWLVWVFGNQAGPDATALLLGALVLVGLAGWIYGRFGGLSPSPAVVTATILAVGGAGASVLAAARIADPALAAAQARETSGWEPFSPARLAERRAEGTPVFIDFTADWCLSCKVNDRVALRTAAVEAAFADAGVALLVADWTLRDAAIAETIEGYGRSGVPLYVMYPADPDADPEILPAVLTPGLVIEAIERAVEG